MLGKTVQSCVTNLLCNHGKLPYHKLRQLKYVERDVINQIVDFGTNVEEKSVKLKSEDCTDGNEMKTETNHQNSEFKIEEEVSENKQGIDTQIAEAIPPEYDVKVEEKVEIQSKSIISLENLMLCEECVVSDLRQHLYDLTLEQDFKKIGNLQNRDPETGWWVVKDDFRNFRKMARQGKLSYNLFTNLNSSIFISKIRIIFKCSMDAILIWWKGSDFLSITLQVEIDRFYLGYHW